MSAKDSYTGESVMADIKRQMEYPLLGVALYRAQAQALIEWWDAQQHGPAGVDRGALHAWLGTLAYAGSEGLGAALTASECLELHQLLMRLDGPTNAGLPPLGASSEPDPELTAAAKAATAIADALETERVAVRGLSALIEAQQRGPNNEAIALLREVVDRHLLATSDGLEYRITAFLDRPEHGPNSEDTARLDFLQLARATVYRSSTGTHWVVVDERARDRSGNLGKTLRAAIGAAMGRTSATLGGSK